MDSENDFEQFLTVGVVVPVLVKNNDSDSNNDNANREKLLEIIFRILLVIFHGWRCRYYCHYRCSSQGRERQRFDRNILHPWRHPR